MQGFEERAVVQSQGPNGQSNRPARQLGQVGVQAPRGGSLSEFGKAESVLNETLKMGGEALQQFVEKRKMKDRLAGKMDYTQGRTEAELTKAGAPTARLEGFKALKAKTAYDEWFAKTKHDIDNGRGAESPEDFKASLMQDAAGVFDSIDLNDPDSAVLAESFIENGFNDLIQSHTVQHAMYMRDDVRNTLANTLVSSSLAGDVESIETIVNDPSSLGLELGDDEINDVLVRAARQTLQEGDFKVFDALGGEQGLRDRNISEGQMQSLQNVYKQAQSIEEASNMQEIAVAQNAIMRDVKGENISMQEAFDRLDIIRENYRQDPGYSRSMVNSIVAEYGANASMQEAAAKLSNPYFIEDAAELMREVQFEGIVGSNGTNKALALAEKYDLDTKMTKNFLDDVTTAHNRYESKVTNEMEAHYAKVKSKQEKETKAMSLINNNFANAGDMDSSVKQLAMNMKKDIIVKEVVNDENFDSEEEKVGEIVRRHVEFMRTSPVRDNNFKQEISVLAQGAPTGATGEINTEHLNSLQYFQSMRESGMSDRLIKEYYGSAYEYMSTAALLAGGTLDPETAITQAYETTLAATDGAITPRTNANEAFDEWQDVKEEFMDSLEPSMLGSMFFGGEADGKYDEVLTDQVREAVLDNPDLDAWAKDQIRVTAKAFPSWPKEAVMDQVKRNMSSWEYVMGELVPPRNGQTISKMMGLDGNAALESNSAMLEFMADNSDLLFPEGTDGREWFESRWSHYVSKPWKKWSESVERKKINSSFLNLGTFFEENQRIKNDIKMMRVQSLSNGQLMISMFNDSERTELVGQPIRIHAKDIGDYYKAKKTQKLRESTKRSLPGQLISNSLEE